MIYILYTMKPYAHKPELHTLWHTVSFSHSYYMIYTNLSLNSIHNRWYQEHSVGLHFGSKRTDKLSIFIEELSRNSVFLNRSEAQAASIGLITQYPHTTPVVANRIWHWPPRVCLGWKCPVEGAWEGGGATENAQLTLTCCSYWLLLALFSVVLVSDYLVCDANILHWNFLCFDWCC